MHAIILLIVFNLYPLSQTFFLTIFRTIFIFGHGLGSRCIWHLGITILLKVEQNRISKHVDFYQDIYLCLGTGLF